MCYISVVTINDTYKALLACTGLTLAVGSLPLWCPPFSRPEQWLWSMATYSSRPTSNIFFSILRRLNLLAPSVKSDQVFRAWLVGEGIVIKPIFFFFSSLSLLSRQCLNPNEWPCFGGMGGIRQASQSVIWESGTWLTLVSVDRVSVGVHLCRRWSPPWNGNGFVVPF